MGILLIGVMLLLYITLPFAIQSRPSRGILDLVLYLAFPAPFGLVGFYLVVRCSGRVVLTDQAVVLQRFDGIKHIYCDEIVDFQDKDYHVPPNFVLKTNEKKLKIPRQLQDFPQFYAILRGNIPILLQAEQSTLPWKLRVKFSSLMVYGLTFLGLMSFFSFAAYGIARDRGDYRVALISWLIVMAGYIILPVFTIVVPRMKQPV